MRACGRLSSASVLLSLRVNPLHQKQHALVASVPAQRPAAQ
jgi:hypothetical protein